MIGRDPRPLQHGYGTMSALIVTVRGSTEPASGSRLLTPIARRIAASSPGAVRITELDYPATFVRFNADHPVQIELGDSPVVGTANLVTLLNTEAMGRSDQRVVLLGWSQGAQIIGDALLPPGQRHAGNDAPALDENASRQIAAVALFGNPAFTAGEPYNEGDLQPGVSGIRPRAPGALRAYATRLRDYCARNDLAAQATPSATIEGHVAYFHNDLPDRAAAFATQRLREEDPCRIP